MSGETERPGDPVIVISREMKMLALGFAMAVVTKELETRPKDAKRLPWLVEALSAVAQEIASDQQTPEQIVRGARSLARVYYEMMGCAVPAGYKFETATHPQERLCWQMACYAYERLTDTEVEGCLMEIYD